MRVWWPAKEHTDGRMDRLLDARIVCWTDRLIARLLGRCCCRYIPWDRRLWEKRLREQRTVYRDLLREFVVDGMNDVNWRSPGYVRERVGVRA